MAEKHKEIVRTLMTHGAGHVVILHVPEEERGAALPVLREMQDASLDVRRLNQAYEAQDLVPRLERTPDPRAEMPHIFGGEGMRVIYLTGWGSDPRAADRLLIAVYAKVLMQADMRLVVMNNAAPVPHMFTSSGPTAYPDPEGFAAHVCSLLSIPREKTSLYELSRDRGPETAL